MNRIVLALGIAASLSVAHAQTTTIRFATWAGGDGLALLKTLSGEYSAKHPGVQINIEVTPFADYGRKIAVQVASGDAPDIAWLAERDVPTFIANKTLLNLRSVVNTKEFNVADFPASTLSLWKSGSNIYGIPFSNSPLVLFYNKDLFQKAGIRDPLQQYADGKWAYGNFQAAAKTIKDKTGLFGARVARLDPKAWAGGPLAVLWSNGGSIYTKDMKCALNTPGSVNGFTLLHNMMFRDASMPRPGDQTTFESGRLGMYVDNVSYSAQLREAPFKWGVAPLPKGTTGRVTQLGQAGYVVFSKARNPGAAADFLAFLASGPVMQRTAKFFPPPRKSVLNSSAYLQSNPLIPPSALKTALVNQLSSARVLLTGPNWLKENDIITSGLDRIFQPNADLPNVLNSICRAVDAS